MERLCWYCHQGFGVGTKPVTDIELRPHILWGLKHINNLKKTDIDKEMTLKNWISRPNHH